MPDLLSTSLSGMLAFQRALDMTGHNIANANTPGYSRQVAEFSSRPGQNVGNGYIGAGTQISTIKRIYDTMLGQQLQTSTSGHARFATMNTLASRLDSLLADANTGLSGGFQSFFGALQDVTNDPSSTPARQALLSDANGLAQRFHSIDQRLNETGAEVNQRISLAVNDINRIAVSIAEVNEQIARARGRSAQPPNDLLDRRDQLVRDLASQVSVSTALQDDGTMSVFIGSGQTLVIGQEAKQLTVRGSEFDPTRLEVRFQGTSGNVPLDSSLTGGTLGGLLDFRRQVLEPAQQSLGQTAIALTNSFNEQHRAGMDMRGALGGDFFAIDSPSILHSASNTGSGTAAATVADLGAFTGEDYILQFDGASYSLLRASDNQPVAMTGSGTPADPFLAGGLSITVGGAAAVGDRIMIRGAHDAAGSVRTLISDPQAIAMAAPTRTSISLGNIGDATVSPATVVDHNDPALLTTSVIEFINPTTYTINGAGSFTYTDSASIVINGSQLSLQGSPQTGDQFTLEPNFGATGDNSNGLLLADVQSAGLLDGGTVSINANYTQLVAGVGGTTRQIQANFEAQSVVLANVESAQLTNSGVNLDEEAANLIRYQQAYQAAAQVVSVARTLFDSLLNATRR
jgi:flagellar hook-associated protein 1 FlgK